jgi:hypothetical protein
MLPSTSRPGRADPARPGLGRLAGVGGRSRGNGGRGGEGPGKERRKEGGAGEGGRGGGLRVPHWELPPRRWQLPRWGAHASPAVTTSLGPDDSD